MAPKFLPLDWPTFLSAISHLASSTSLPLLTHLVIHQLSFDFPATLTLIQVSTTALCLWFWTIFGLFKVRTLSLYSLVPLALSSATQALLSTFTIASTSLLVYQTARVLSATLVLAIRLRNAVPAVMGLLFAISLVPSSVAFEIPLAYVVFAVLNALLIHPVAAATSASELQLQLFVKTISSVFLLAALPLDDYSSHARSIINFSFDETATLVISSTGLLTFFAFVSIRATIHRLPTELSNWLTFATSLAVYLSHFILFDNSIRPSQVISMIGLSGSWLYLAECRRHRIENRESEEQQVSEQHRAAIRGSLILANAV